MRTTIEKVRAAVVVGAALVALIVGGFLAMAHYKAHRLLRDLPTRLGLDIQNETNGYTVSQSVRGRTVFTLHAAKATQHKDGITALQDVGVVLYGQTGERADRIYGKQFEYDQKNGVVRAMGEVQLDLQAPAPASASGKAAYVRGGRAEPLPVRGDGDAQPIHVVTSGLVFVQSLGVASTDQPIRFAYHGMTGQARGAAYNSDTGVTTLENEVRLSTLRDGRPTVLTATHAELTRASHDLVLRTARYVALEGADRDHGTSESMTAGTMVVHLGQNGGGIERAEGSGGVEVASGASHMQAPEGDVRLSAEGRPEMARMTGGVRFASEQEKPGNALEGQAASGVAHFDDKGTMETVQLTGGVRVRSQGATALEMRTLQGDGMDLRLAGDTGRGRRWVEQATMHGNARVESALPAVAGHTAGSEAMRADVLVGLWRQERGEAVLHEVIGEGRSEIRRSRDGVDEVSQGERLRAEFGVAAAGSAEEMARQGITTAMQQGDVTLERVMKAKDGSTETTRARADRASYDAGSGQVSLTGGAEIADAESVVRADRVMMVEGTGDAEATGAVQVTYRQASARKIEATRGEEETGLKEDAGRPVHAVAERAVMQKEAGVTTFFGGSSLSRGGTTAQRARVWQGGSQVEAPVLVFGQKERTLDAYGVGGSEEMPVRTVLVSKADQDGESASASGSKARTQVLRVQSGRLHYADALRRADFSKGVVLEDMNGTMTSRDAVALLAQVAKPSFETPQKTSETTKGPGGLSGFSGAGLERATATGDVVIRQPGRVATGQQAVYTAADGVFVLTGGGGVRPTATDATNGSVTGAVLRFRSGDNSVMVDGRVKDGMPVTGDGRVHTRTRVKQ